jgi:hypothetical protein
MKSITKSILIFIVLVGTSYLSLAQTQVPEKMSYQAVIRNSSGQLVSTQTVGMQISILQGTASGTSVYVETHTPTTNINGLVSLEIGAGIAQSGNFSAIDWANGPYFIKTETDIDGGTNYTISGTSQLLSVPYALHAKTAETVVGGISEIDPEFNASVAAGITSADTANWNDKFSGDYNDLINTPTNVSTFTNDAGYITSYTEADPIFGTSVAAGITSADTANWNSKLNNFIESDTMIWKINGGDIYFNTGKVGIGTNAPSLKLETTEDVSFNGVRVGRGNGNQSSNIVIGSNSLKDNTTGTSNIAIGNYNLRENLDGYGNTSIGLGSLSRSTSGSKNTSVGLESLNQNIWGNENTAIGYNAGWSSNNGSGNVFIGYEAGKWESGSNKLYIANSSTSTPLIYGDFSTERIGLGTNNPQYKLDVTGDINFTGNIRKNGTALVMDGSETKINAGDNIIVTGNGTAATPYTISAAKPKFYLGQDTLGGIVFYIYIGADGQQHGLIVSKIETSAAWQSSTSLVNADRTEDGSYNTSLMNNSPAKDWITANFSSEWYLPSIDELNILWNNRFHVNKTARVIGTALLVTNANYWSSSEHHASNAFGFNFYISGTKDLGKTFVTNLRAVRAF